MLEALLNEGAVAVCLAAIGLLVVTALIGAAAFETLAPEPWYGAVLGSFFGLCWVIGIALEVQAHRHEG